MPDPVKPAAGTAAEDTHVQKFMTDMEQGIHGDRIHDDGAEAPAATNTNGKADDAADTTTTQQQQQEEGQEDTQSETLELEVDSQDIEVSKEGKLVWRVDPEDPNSTFYTGKDMKELMSNIRNGVKEKDATIKKIKAGDRVVAAEDTIRKVMRGRTTQDAPEAPIPPPDMDVITRKHCDTNKINPAILNWSNQQWKDFAREKNLESWEVTELRQNINSIRVAATEEYSVKNTEYINGSILSGETAEVIDLLEKSGADPDKFDFEKVLDAVIADANSFEESGLLKHGKIVKLAALEIARISKGKITSTVEDKINKTLAEGEEARRSVAGTGGKGRAGGGEFNKSTKVPKTSEEAYQQAMAEWRASQRKRA